ncbi:MAG: alpha/beta hydrolase fold domain-containing protein [Peptostreptococcaceae bacterium]
MNKGLRKALLIFTVTVVTTGAITGCQKNETTTNDSSAPTTEQSTTTEESTTDDSSKPEKGMGGPGGAGGGLVKQEAVDTSDITNKYLDVAYANTSESQKLDIYLPENIDESEPVPVIVYVHGGGFMMGDKTSGCLGSVLEGLEKGYAVVSVNYRMSGEETFPAAIEDVKAAIRYVKANASEYNIDTENFAIWGESAGGNIASMVGTTGDDTTFDNSSLGNSDQSSAVQAVVDWFGPIEFNAMDSQFAELGITPKMGTTSSETSAESKYIGGDISQDEYAKIAEQANPTNYISKNDPAFLIQHGTADTNVPVTQSLNFAEKLKSVLGEDKVTVETMEGAAHGDMGDVKAFETEENIARVFDFLDSQLKK